MIKYKDIKNNELIRTFIDCADDTLNIMGYTEHSFAHLERCAHHAGYILQELEYDERTIELAMIAGFIHDIGNMVNRHGHAHHGAIMVYKILSDMGMEPSEIGEIVRAVGHHDEETATAVSAICAALIIADKSDVRHTRVRHYDPSTVDIHDRVNYAVKKSDLSVQREKETITLTLTIDTEVCSVTDYFEIFIGRMLLCRKAAQFFEFEFKLVMNGAAML